MRILQARIKKESKSAQITSRQTSSARATARLAEAFGPAWSDHHEAVSLALAASRRLRCYFINGRHRYDDAVNTSNDATDSIEAIASNSSSSFKFRSESVTRLTTTKASASSSNLLIFLASANFSLLISTFTLVSSIFCCHYFHSLSFCDYFTMFDSLFC